MPLPKVVMNVVDAMINTIPHLILLEGYTRQFIRPCTNFLFIDQFCGWVGSDGPSNSTT